MAPRTSETGDRKDQGLDLKARYGFRGLQDLGFHSRLYKETDSK